MVPVHLKCSLTSPSSRLVSGAYRVDSVVNSPVTWPVDPTDRVVIGPSALACYSAMRGLWRTRVITTGEGPLRSRGEGPPLSREPPRDGHLSLPFHVASPLRLVPARPRRFSGKLVGNFRQPAVAARDAMTAPVHSPCLAAPSWFSPRGRGRGPPILPMTSPLTDVRGGFTGKCIGEIAGRSDRPWGALSTACQGRASGAPPPGGGCASLRNAPLDAAVAQIHRRGLGAPGPAQGGPLWHPAPRWTREDVGHSPRCAVPAFARGRKP